MWAGHPDGFLQVYPMWAGHPDGFLQVNPMWAGHPDWVPPGKVYTYVSLGRPL